jgi:hypothetical protein
MKSRFNRRLQSTKINYIKKNHIKEDQLKKHLLMDRLEEKLGKPRTEIKHLISDNLLATLSKVPFSIQRDF